VLLLPLVLLLLPVLPLPPLRLQLVVRRRSKTVDYSPFVPAKAGTQSRKPHT